MSSKELAARAALLAQHVGAGLEHVTPDDLAIDWLKVVNALSPEKDEDDRRHVKGCGEGDIVATQSGLIWPRGGDGVVFIPFGYRKRWIEWGERSKQEGIVAVHDSPKIMKQAVKGEKGFFLPNGNEIAETAYFFGAYRDRRGMLKPCIISMRSTQLAVASRMMTYASNELLEIEQPDGSVVEAAAPLYWRAFRMTTFKDRRAAGAFWAWRVERAETIEEIAIENEDALEEYLAEAVEANEALEDGRIIVAERLLAAGGKADEATSDTPQGEEVM